MILKKGDMSKIALGLAVVGGVMVALAVAPGLGVTLKLIDNNPRVAMDKLERALRRLLKSGDLEIEDTPHGKRYRITKPGEQKLARLQFDEYALTTKKKWNGKWWVICFDIPETNQYARRVFQRKLSYLGFYRLQNSVFVYPYEQPELLALAFKAFGLDKAIRTIVADQINNEKQLLNFFHLKR